MEDNLIDRDPVISFKMSIAILFTATVRLTVKANSEKKPLQQFMENNFPI